MKPQIPEPVHLAPSLSWVLFLAALPLPLSGADLDVSADTTLASGVYSYDAVIVRANSTLTLGGDPSTGTGVRIDAASLVVEADAVISATGQGYPLNQGPGANPDTDIGPSHGGRGGSADYSVPYGSATARRSCSIRRLRS